MNVTIKEEDNDYVVYFEGRLDTAASAKVENEMAPLHNVEGHDFILDCTKLEYIDVSNLNIGKATHLESFFDGCEKLTSLIFGPFDTSD